MKRWKQTAQSSRGLEVVGGMRRMDGRFHKGGKKVLWHFWNKSFKMLVTMAVFFFCAKRDTRCNLAPAPGIFNDLQSPCIPLLLRGTKNFKQLKFTPRRACPDLSGGEMCLAPGKMKWNPVSWAKRINRRTKLVAKSLLVACAGI